MALVTERALKRKNCAVITVESNIANIATGRFAVEFEWFNTEGAASAWMTDWTDWAAEDAVAYDGSDPEEPAYAYLTLLIPDTENMAVTRAVVSPANAQLEHWKETVLADITVLYDKPEEVVKKKVVVKARRRGVVLGGSTVPEPEEAPKVRGRKKKIESEAEVEF